MPDPRPAPLDTVPAHEVVDRLLAAQDAALAAVRTVATSIAEGADLVAGRFAAGGRLLVLAQAGTASRVVDLVTGGLAREFGLADGAVTRVDDLTARRPTARDAVLVVATGAPDRTGDTPEIAGALAAVHHARAGLVLVTTGPATGRDGDVVIAPAVGAEPIRGLDRFAAGTALKAVLDALTTAVMSLLGRVHGDLPVDLVAETDADREQVVGMVAEIAGVDDDTARAAAERSGHDVRVAVLGLAGGLEPVRAATLAASRRTLRDALTDLPRRPPPRPTAPSNSAGDEGAIG